MPVLAAVCFGCAILVTRFLILLAVGLATEGDEFANDTSILMGFARDPSSLLTATAFHSEYPPLLGFAEGVFAYPLALFLPDFYALRATFALYEFLTALVFWLVLTRILESRNQRILVAALFAVLPIGWMSTVVMAQEEIIVAFFIALTLLLLVERRHYAALVVCGLGVATAKVFLILPLAAAIVLLREKPFLKRVAAGLTPVAIFYGLVLIFSVASDRAFPLATALPPNDFGVNAWTLLLEHSNVTLEQAKWSSTLLTVICTGLLLASVWNDRRPAPQLLAYLFTVLFLWLFVTFYLVNPEYYVYVLPLIWLIIARHSRVELFLLTLLFTAPWLVNLGYGVHQGPQGSSPGRETFIDLYERLVPIRPELLRDIALWITIVTTIGAALRMTLELGRSRSPKPEEN
jgi:hypothetical protein